MADGHIILRTEVDSSGLKNDAKKLASKFEAATKAVEVQARKVEDLHKKLAALQSGEAQGTSAAVAKAKKESDTLIATLSELEKKYEELSRARNAIADKPLQGTQADLTRMSFSGQAQKVGENYYTPEAAAQLQKLEAELRAVGAELDAAQAKANTAGKKLVEATGAATQAEIQKTSAEIEKATAEYGRLQAKADKAGAAIKKSMDESKMSTSAVGRELTKLGDRLASTVKSALLFSVLYKGLAMFKTTIASVLMSNESFRQSLYNLQAALWTAFAPILQVVVPALQTLITYVTAAATAIGKLIAALTGKSYDSMVEMGKALQQQAAAYGASTKAAGKNSKATKKNTEEQKKQLAAFDELQILKEDKDTSGGGSGAQDENTAGVGAAFGNLKEGGEIEGLAEAEERLKGIAVLAGSVGLALAGWTIIDFLTSAGQASGILQNLIGTIAMVGGGLAALYGYSDAWVNGIDWGNFLITMGGLATFIAGIAMKVSPMAAAAAAIGGGIALIILGVKDMIKNGATLKNVLTSVIGALTLFLATLKIAGAPIAIVVTAIAALVAAFVYLWKTNEDFRKFWINLWETIKKAALSAWETVIKPTLQAIGDFVIYLWEHYIQPFWEGFLKPTIQAIIDAVQGIWETCVKPTLQAIGDFVMYLWEHYIQPFWEGFLKPTIQAITAAVQEIWQTCIEPTLEDIGNAVNELWTQYIQPFWVTYLKPAIDAIWKAIDYAWNKVIYPIIKTINEVVLWLWTDVLAPFIDDFLIPVFVATFQSAWNTVSGAVEIAYETIKGVLDTLQGIFEGVIEFLTGVFTGDWEKAWEGVKKVFTSIINGIISAFESMINFIIRAVNKFTHGIEKLVANVGDLIGADWKLNLHINEVQLPRLAQGAVIPPNKQFLAVLGDQKQGTNVEAPLSTIEQAVQNVLDRRGDTFRGDITIPLMLDETEFGRAIITASQLEQYRRSGARVSTKIGAI